MLSLKAAPVEAEARRETSLTPTTDLQTGAKWQNEAVVKIHYSKSSLNFFKTMSIMTDFEKIV